MTILSWRILTGSSCINSKFSYVIYTVIKLRENTVSYLYGHFHFLLLLAFKKMQSFLTTLEIKPDGVLRPTLIRRSNIPTIICQLLAPLYFGKETADWFPSLACVASIDGRNGSFRWSLLDLSRQPAQLNRLDQLIRLVQLNQACVRFVDLASRSFVQPYASAGRRRTGIR